MFDTAVAERESAPVNRFAFAVAFLLACQGPDAGPGETTAPDTCSAAGCACDDVCDAGLVCASQICVPSDEPGRTTGGPADASSTSSSAGEETGGSETTGETTGWASEGSTDAGTSTSTGSSSSTGPSEPFCGDGAVDEGEECDDGNDQPGDGCDAACALEPWQHVGVAHDVPVADLHGWTQCWADDYSGTAKRLVSSLAESCTGAQLLVACRLVDDDTLALAAHAPREDVMFPVNYLAGERHEANGIAWYWSPPDKYVGFAPAGNTTPCILAGEDEQLCVKTTGAGLNDTFAFGNRCGAKLGFSLDDQSLWERVVFQTV